MMIHVKQYRPGFVDLDDPLAEARVATVAELVGLEWISRWRALPKFHRFSVSDGRRLMAETHEGFTWWVIAYVKGDVSDLPVWHARYRKDEPQ